MMMPARRLLPLCILVLQSTITFADFGDYVDPTFDCPAMTTCTQVCVETVEDCPVEMQCSENKMLCADGSCATFCDPNLVSPCERSCAPVACPKLIAPYEVCRKNFTSFYEYANNCEVELHGVAVTESDFTWTDPAFLFCYAWVIGVSAGIVLWCWYNHRINPVEGSTKVLQVCATKKNATSVTSQTGYKRNPVGLVLYWWTMVTYVGWMFLLAGVSYVYMDNLDDDANTVFILKAWAVVWNIGLFWSFVLKWPLSIKSLFLRRCPLAEATEVSVYHEIEQGPEVPDEPSIFPKAMEGFVDGFRKGMSAMMTAIFADAGNRPDPRKAIVEYCPVLTNADGTKYFVFLFRRYNYDDEKKIFVPGIWKSGKTFRDIAPKGIEPVDETELAFELAVQGDGGESDTSQSSGQRSAARKKYRVHGTGLTKEQVDERFRTVGRNQIDMTKPSFLASFSQECTKPFYVYQFYILWIWITTQYWHMAIVNWGIIFSTICVVAWLRYQGALVLYGLSNITGTASVLRDGAFVDVDQQQLVPGDTVRLYPGITYCDMLLLTGEAIVDESALTGEATPQAKAPIDVRSEDTYDPKNHKNKLISAGTKILECEDALAVVKNTASYTMKGELLRNIIAFRRYTPKLEGQLPMLVAILIAWSSILFFLVLFNSSDVPVIAWTLGMTAFANCFPALLPISFTVPVGISFKRMSKNKIACSNSDSILIAGKVNKVFFDKTGTLTKQGLDFISCRSVDSWDCGYWSSDPIALAMSSCHSLTKSAADDIIIGNPVDRAMFAASKAKLLDVDGVSAIVKDKRGKMLQVVRRFDFDHNTMTQSVIIRLPNGSLKAIVKGSGESISKRCLSDTMPASFDAKLDMEAKSGIYQIAIGWKELPKKTSVSRISRMDVENELAFIGVLNFSNQLREETPDVIRQLNEADVQPIMLTGDNLFTGVFIARKSGIIPEDTPVTIGQLDAYDNLTWTDEDGASQETPVIGKETQVAMTGEAWYHLLRRSRDYAFALAPHVHVVGRCSPHDKVSVVDTFVSLGYCCAAVGDGGNDCGMLKASHVGLALSDSDASLVAAFTAVDKEITSILTLLKEGRAALASTLATYKYVCLYGQITSYNQLIMYYFQASFSEWMWTLIDGFWTVSFTLTLPLSLPSTILSKNRPTSSILGYQTVSSVVGIMGIHFIFITIAFATLFNEAWYQCRKWDVNSISTANILQTSDNYEITVIFIITGFQCLCSAITMNFGYEFRRNWLRNWVFVTLIVVFVFIHFWITLVPGHLSCLWRINCDNENVVRSVTSSELIPIFNPYNTTVMPVSFRWKLIFIMIGNGLSVVFYDYFIVNGIRRWRAGKEETETTTKLPADAFEDQEVEEVKEQALGGNSDENGPAMPVLTRGTTEDGMSSEGGSTMSA